MNNWTGFVHVKNKYRDKDKVMFECGIKFKNTNFFFSNVDSAIGFLEHEILNNCSDFIDANIKLNTSKKNYEFFYENPNNLLEDLMNL